MLRHLFVWDSRSGFKDLGSPAGYVFTSVMGKINETGLASILMSPAGSPDWQAFVVNVKTAEWYHIELPEAFPADLNDSGQLVGYSNTPDGLYTHAFIWDSTNGVRDLTPNLAGNSRAYSITDKGLVLGYTE